VNIYGVSFVMGADDDNEAIARLYRALFLGEVDAAEKSIDIVRLVENLEMPEEEAEEGWDSGDFTFTLYEIPEVTDEQLEEYLNGS
jgi:hypothetical protein